MRQTKKLHPRRTAKRFQRTCPEPCGKVRGHSHKDAEGLCRQAGGDPSDMRFYRCDVTGSWHWSRMLERPAWAS